MAAPLRLCPRLRCHISHPPPSPPFLRCFPATSPPLSSVHIARGLRLRGAPEASEDESVEENDPAEKSRNEKKREARRALKWGMDLAHLSPPQIKRILRVVSAEEEAFEAIALVKRLGPDVREGKRRQFNYIGKLLRNVQPDLMDSLIQASKDHDNSKLQALIGHETFSDEDSDEDDIDSEEDFEDSIDAASRWFDGLVNKDSIIIKEVYSLHNVEFDRQELRKLVRRVQTIEEANSNAGESVALTKARKSLLGFLRRLAKQSQLEV